MKNSIHLCKENAHISFKFGPTGISTKIGLVSFEGTTLYNCYNSNGRARSDM